MPDDRIDEALSLIEETLKEIYTEGASVSRLLLRCSNISKLIGSKDAEEWINFELNGYPNPSIIGQKSTNHFIPKYRCYDLNDWKPIGLGPLDMIEKHSSLDTIEQRSIFWRALFRFIPYEVPFYVTFPIGYIEDLKENPSLFRIIQNPEQQDDQIRVTSVIDRNRLRSILHIVRARINDYLITQQIALKFHPILQHIFDETKDLVSNRLARIDPRLFDEITKMVLRQQETNNELEWRATADACRNTLQRFTEILLIQDMLPDEQVRPREDDTVGKVALVIAWIKSRIGIGHGDEEIHGIKAGHDYLIEYFKSLKARTEKTKHKPMGIITKDEVDRIVIYLILFIADLIRLLDRADYPWPEFK